MTYIKSFEDLAADIRGDITKYRSLPLANVREYIKLVRERVSNIVALKQMASAMRTAPDLSKHIWDNYAKRIVDASARKENIACNIYCDLARKAKTSDLQSAFASYFVVATTYQKLLEAIDKTADTWFKDQQVSIFNTKVSHVVIYSLLSEADIFSNYTTQLMHCVLAEVLQHNNIKELAEVKRYMLSYLVEKQAVALELLTLRLNSNPIAVISDMAKSRNLMDANIVNQEGDSNMGFINPADMPGSIRQGLDHAPQKAKGLMLSVFRWLGERWMLYKHAKYLKQLKEKEWLEAHIALLQLDLQGVDPNSDEYRRLVKIIDNYSEQLATIQQKIQVYEEDN